MVVSETELASRVLHLQRRHHARRGRVGRVARARRDQRGARVVLGREDIVRVGDIDADETGGRARLCSLARRSHLLLRLVPAGALHDDGGGVLLLDDPVLHLPAGRSRASLSAPRAVACDARAPGKTSRTPPPPPPCASARRRACARVTPVVGLGLVAAACPRGLRGFRRTRERGAAACIAGAVAPSMARARPLSSRAARRDLCRGARHRRRFVNGKTLDRLSFELFLETSAFHGS